MLSFDLELNDFIMDFKKLVVLGVGNELKSDDGAGPFIIGVNAVLNGTTLKNNSAINGSGAYVEGNYAVFDNVTALLNNASSTGAGIYVKGNYTNITNSNVNNNTADDFGAGAYIDGSYAVVDTSNFKYNVAEGFDGLTGPYLSI